MNRIQPPRPNTSRTEMSNPAPVLAPVLVDAKAVPSLPAVAMAPLLLSGQPAAGVMASGANPFAQLVSPCAVSSRPTLAAEACGLERDVAPSPRVLAALAKWQSSQPSSPAHKTREGFMLTINDAAEQRAASSGVERSVTSAVGQKLIEIKSEIFKSEAKLANHVQHVACSMRSSYPRGMDVHAFVQAVLRESYLLQSLELEDYGNAVEALNERRKKIREQLRLVRDARKSGGQLPPDFTWLEFADQPFKPVGEKGEQDAGTGESRDRSESASETRFTAELARRFGVRMRDLESAAEPLSSIARYLTGAETWAQRWERLKSTLSDPTQAERFRASLETVASLGPADFVMLVETLRMNDQRELLGVIVENCTQEQLGWFEGWYSKDHLDSIDRLTGGKVRARAADLATRTIDLPSSVTSDERLAAVVAMYDELRAFPEQRDVHLARLQSAMWDLPADAARSFLSAIAADLKERGEEPATFDAIFFATNGRALFEQGSASEWSFLAGVGGEAQRFFEQWTGTGDVAWRAPTERNMVAPAGLEVSAGRSDRASMMDLQVGGTVNTMTSEAPSQPTGDTSEVTEETLESYEQYLEDRLHDSEGDAQLANMDLQNALQRQQQTLQMMSNVSKLLHDVMMAIIRNIGG